MLAHYRYADRLLSLDTGAATQYYHFDALGSTVNLTTETASVQVSYKLDPWGHIKSQTGTSVNRQIFTGQEHDENTGLIYFGARYYDPDTARFITQDSYLGESSAPPSLHRYLYAYSNPTVYVDLYGYSVDEAVEQEGVKEQANMGSYMRKALQSYNDIMMGQENLRALSHYSYGLFSGVNKLGEAAYTIVRHPVGTTVALGEGIGKLAWRLTDEPENVKNDIAEWWKKVESDPDKLATLTGETVSTFATPYAASKAVGVGGQLVRTTSAFQKLSRVTGSVKSKLPGVLFEDVGQIALKRVPGLQKTVSKIKEIYEKSPLANEAGGGMFSKVRRVIRYDLLKKIRKATQSNNSDIFLEGKIARKFRDRIIAFQKEVRKSGRRIGEIDIELDKAIIEITSGTGRGKMKQVKRLTENTTLNPNKKPVLVYGPKITAGRIKAIEKAGGKVFKSSDKLETFLEGL